MYNDLIIDLYKHGYSIDFIVNNLYSKMIKQNKIINAKSKRIILIENCILKKDVRGVVYKTIYKNIKNPSYLTSGISCHI